MLGIMPMVLLVVNLGPGWVQTLLLGMQIIGPCYLSRKPMCSLWNSFAQW